MAKKAKTRSEVRSAEGVKAQDEALKAERRSDQAQAGRELAQAGSPAQADRSTVREAQQDVRRAAQETQERAHAIPSLGREEELGQRHELPISDSNPPSDQSIHELTTTDLHPSVTTPQGTQAESIGDVHDLRDVNFRALAWWFVGLFGLIAVAMVLMAVMFRIMETSQAYKDELPTPLLADARPEAPRPRALLPNPELPLQEYNQQQHRFVTEYSRDPESGEIRIPVERAMELMAQNRLPSAPSAPTKTWRNPVQVVPPSNQGVGNNDPFKDYRVPHTGEDFPAARLHDQEGNSTSAEAGQEH